jgi:hypothetical protein
LPENIPPAEHIKEVAKRLKGATPPFPTSPACPDAMC